MTVVVALTGMLAIALHQTYVRHSRFVDWQEQVVRAHDAYRVASSLLSADFREAVPAEDDVVLLAPDSISVRAPTGFGIVCATLTSPAVIAIARVMGRMPEASGDSLMVYATTGWRTLHVVGTDTPGQRGVSCGGRTPEAQLQLPTGGTADVPVGAPVRVFRRHIYHLVANGGETWLGRTTTSGTEPLVGPLLRGGLRFRLLDADGLDESVPADVAGVEFRMILPGRSSFTATTATADTVVSVFQVRNR
jgi:hypothetical protein